MQDEDHEQSDHCQVAARQRREEPGAAAGYKGTLRRVSRLHRKSLLKAGFLNSAEKKFTPMGFPQNHRYIGLRWRRRPCMRRRSATHACSSSMTNAASWTFCGLVS